MRTHPEMSRTREHGTQVTRPDIESDPGLARVNAIRRIVTNGQYEKVDGCMIDLFSASAVIAVYDALNPQNKMKYRGMPAPAMADIAFRLTKKS